MPGTADDPYWSVDIPRLTEGEAKQLVEWADATQFGWAGSTSAVNPTMFLTLHLDRDSTRMLYDGLMRTPETATPEHGLAGSIGEWLNRSFGHSVAGSFPRRLCRTLARENAHSGEMSGRRCD
jgi:hypothetical protein